MNNINIEKIVVAYPSGNTTALVFDNLKSINREELNDSIMNSWKLRFPKKPQIEQCCFVEFSKKSKILGKVDMLGGEFCGNATRSAVWVLSGGKDGSGLIKTSGYNKPLKYKIVKGIVKIEMPQCKIIKYDNGVAIEFDGITQYVVESGSTGKILEELLKSGYMDSKSQSAFGVSRYEPKTNKAFFSVWVRNVNTIFDETACGSGTAAIGIAQAVNLKKISLDIIQPSGESITTSAEVEDQKVIKSEISGPVEIIYAGDLELKL
jgi:diaminopimelate epimerase